MNAVRLASMALLTAAIGAGCGKTPPAPEGALPARVDRLRANGDVAKALDAAQTWAATTRTSPCEAAAATRALLARATLSPAGRARLAAADSLEPKRLEAVRRYRYARALGIAGRQLALRAKTLGDRDPETVRTQLDLAAIYHVIGEYDRTRALAEGALARLGPPAPETAVLLAESHRRLSILDKDLRRYEDARRHLDRAEQTLRDCGCNGGPTANEVLATRASLLRRTHHYPEAETAYRKVLSRVRGYYGPGSTEAATRAVWFSFVLFADRRFDEALALAAPARDVLVGAPDRDDAVLRAVIDLLVDIHGVRGDLPGAEALARQGEVLAERSWAAIPGGFGLSRQVSTEDRAIAAACLDRGDYDAAWPFVNAANGGMTRVVSAHARDLAGRGGARLDSLARRTEVRATALCASPASARAEDWGALAVLDGERFGLEADLAGRTKDEADMSSVQALQDVLAPGEAVVGWFRYSAGPPSSPGEQSRLWGYVVRREGGAHWVELGRWSGRSAENDTLRSLLRLDRALRRASVWPGRVEPDPDLDRWCRDAGARLLDPLRPYLAGVRRLVVCPGPLAPFAPVACWKDSAGADLVDTFEITCAPFPALLTVLRGPHRAPTTTAGPALLVGDPDPVAPPNPLAADPLAALLHGRVSPAGATVLDLATVRSALAGDPATLADLPALPFAGYEIHGIARCVPRPWVLTGPAATEDSVDALAQSSGLRRFGILHFATHALADPDNPSHFALVLRMPGDRASAAGGTEGDGLVSAEEILSGWQVDARLVTLSGCQTGGDATVVRTGEPVGFLQALLRAGAQSVLLSSWKVDDLASALLMVRFYQLLAELDGNKAAALQQAERWLRDITDDRGNRPFAHPVYWSGFVLYGDPL